jgi:GTP 3',8-cyclase
LETIKPAVFAKGRIMNAIQMHVPDIKTLHDDILESCTNLSELTDGFNRKYNYLRLSVIDICNYRCNYCLPDGYQKTTGKHYLSLDEIKQLAQTFADMGIEKIRITGGEPAIRNDIGEIIKILKNTKGIKTVALTTNGYRLAELGQSWLDAGLDAINVSIDSLRPEVFQAITGFDHLHKILDGLEPFYKSKAKVKVNAVLMQDLNAHELSDFVNWVKDKNVALRFIELMETGDNTEFFNKHHLKGSDIQATLIAQGWKIRQKSQSDGPAVTLYHSDSQGDIGLIMPYSKDFCDSCNRLRVSASGKLHLCLFGESGFDLLPLLVKPVTDQSEQDIKTFIQSSLNTKWQHHHLADHESGAIAQLSQIGG